MKILVVDDQPIILLALKKCLTNQGYEVVTAMNVENGIAAYENSYPDLVLVDINMPANDNDKLCTNHQYNADASGLDIIDHIRKVRHDNVPVMVLSGNIDDTVFNRGCKLGILDYLKKPMTFTEIAVKVNSVLKQEQTCELKLGTTLVQNAVVGIVIPFCNNNNNTFLNDQTKNFLKVNSGYHLCFVTKTDDNATLNKFVDKFKDRVSVLKCKTTDQSAEATRIGVLHLAKQQEFDYIGFLDLKLSTNLEDFHSLVNTIKNSEYKLVSASALLNSEVESKAGLSIFSKMLNYVVRSIVGLNLNDVNCTARVMSKEIIENTFKNKFLTQKMFYIEILLRMRKIYGKESAERFISKKKVIKTHSSRNHILNLKDSFLNFSQISQIAMHYR